MEDEIDLRDIFHVLRKNSFLIISIFMIAVVVAGVVSFAMPSVYRCSCVVALGNFGDPIYTEKGMVKQILLSDELLSEVIDQLNLDVPPEDLQRFKQDIEISSVSDTIIKITVETQDQQNVTQILQKMISVFLNRSDESYNKYRVVASDDLLITQENLIRVKGDINMAREVLKEIAASSEISQDVLELRYSRTLEYLQNEESRSASLLARYLDIKRQLDFMENARVIVVTELPVEPVNSRKILIIAVAGVLGLMFGIFAAFLREAFKRPVE